MPRPAGSLGTSPLRTQSPISLISPVSSATGIKSARRDHTALGMIPAKQCFAACNGVGSQVHQRLIVNLQLPLPGPDEDRAPSGAALSAGHQVRVQRSGRYVDRRICRVHRKVCVPKSILKTQAVVRRDGDPDASFYRNFLALTVRRHPDEGKICSASVVN